MFYHLFLFFILLYPLCSSEQSDIIRKKEEHLSVEKIIHILEVKKNELIKTQYYKDLVPFTCLPMNLKKGQRDPLILKIRKKLTLKGYMNDSSLVSDYFDQAVEEGLKKFQADNSIQDDGVFGIRTCQIFNQSEASVIQKIDSTIQSFREEMKRDAKKRIIVNVGTFQAFTVDERGKIDHIQAAVVGMKTRQTPLMDAKIIQIVINPYWGVPNSILFKDKLKKIMENPQYLEERQYQVFDSSNVEVDPEDIDWESYTEKNFPYHIRQRPGTYNALGNIKFILNNKHAIYMHGSPHERDFKRKERAFSSGCIRLEYPIDIAIWLLKGTSYTEEKIDSYLDLEKTVYIDLHKQIDTHIVNWPVFINEDQKVIFGNSFYSDKAEK